MSWEVKTMRSVKSCCNRALIRSDLRRYWPIAAFYMLVWIVGLPVQLWNQKQIYPKYQWAKALKEVVGDAAYMSVIVALIVGVLLAMALYAYMMRPSSVGMMHALPVKRSTQFISHFAAGFGMLTVSNVIIFLLSALAEMDMVVTWKALLLWLAFTELVELFFFALAIICTVFTGWLLAVPVFYVAANCVVFVMYILMDTLGGMVYFGHSRGFSRPAWIYWLTPVLRLTTRVGSDVENYDTVNAIYTITGRSVGVAAIYAGVAIVLLLLAYFLYRKRPSESAGDVVAFRWAQPIVLYAISLLGGFGLGFALYALVNINGEKTSIVLLLSCMVLMGLLCYATTKILLTKSFAAIRKAWKGAIVVVAVLVAVMVGIVCDVTGFENRVPDAKKVEAVMVSLAEPELTLDCDNEESIVAVTELHRLITEQRSEEGTYLELRYEMRNGSTMCREYYLDTSDPAVSKQLDILVKNDNVWKNALFEGSASYDPKDQMLGGTVYGEYNEAVDGYVDGENYWDLTSEQAQAIYDALGQDIKDNAEKDYSFQDIYNNGGDDIRIDLDGKNNFYSVNSLNKDCKHTIALLRQYGMVK